VPPKKNLVRGISYMTGYYVVSTAGDKNQPGCQVTYLTNSDPRGFLKVCFLMVKKSGLRWFGRVECKDDNDWIKCCVTWEVGELDREDAQKRSGGIVLKMTWKV